MLVCIWIFLKLHAYLLWCELSMLCEGCCRAKALASHTGIAGSYSALTPASCNGP